MRNFDRKRLRWLLLVAALAVGLAVLAAGCGGDDEAAAPPAETAAPPAEPPPAEPPAESTPAEPPAESTPAETTPAAETGNRITTPGQCGDPTTQGQPATGEPIKIGGIESDIPGVAFGPILDGTKAYFDCVNDNGGIDGHPIEYIVINDQADGNAAHQAAVKLWEEDGVLGFAGSTSLVECQVNHEYYEQNGINAIVAGATPECFNTPNIAATNQGPYYSVSTATWYAINKRGAKKIVCARANVPGLEFQCGGALVLAEQAGIPAVEIPVDTPIADPTSLAVQMAQEAGEGGAALPGFTEGELVSVLQAAEQQGLLDTVQWYAGATGSSNTVVGELSAAWNGVFFAQSEYNLPETGTGPDTEKYREVMGQYAPDALIGNFTQFGYTAGIMMTEAMLAVVNAGEELNQGTVNAAVRELVNIPTDLLCKAWYFGDLPTHLPNNGSHFSTPQDGQAVLLEPDCLPNPVTNKDIAQAYLDELELGIPQLPGTPSQAELEDLVAQFSTP